MLKFLIFIRKDRNMMKKSKSLFLIVLAALAVTLTACGSGDKAGKSSENGSLSTVKSTTLESSAKTDNLDDSSITIGIAQDLDNLDPHYATGAGTKEILFNIFEGLVKPDKDGNLNPAVAESSTISDDGKTYTFKLRDGIKFQNGNPVTTDDVIYSIERCAGTDGKDPLVSAFSAIKSIKATDDSTIVIELDAPDTEFLSQLTVAIIPKDSDPSKDPVGTGPYKFVSREEQSNVKLTRFDDYWGNKGAIKDITLKVEANADSIVMDLEGGSIDMFMRLTDAQVKQLSDKFDIYEGTMNLVQALYLNNQAEPFNNEKVRKALSYAIDPQGIMKILSGGKGAQIGGNCYPAFTKYFMPELVDTYKMDIEKAKSLLAEAGYPDGFTFTITVPSNYAPHVDTAQIISEQLKQIGVTAKIEKIEWNAWLSDVYGDRKYESTVVGLDASTLSGSALFRRYRSDAHNNFTNFSDAEYDKTLDAALAATADEEKVKYYKQCEQILTDRAANVYIEDLPEYVALNKKYTGYTFYPLYLQDFTTLSLK